jgi:hypothetical protein
MNYNAFISYSHAADNQLAPKLQRALQQFAKPFYKLRALNIFRDQTSLVSTPELWPTIQKALHASEYFILLASKDAAQSTWVQKEVQEWLDTHGGSVKQMLIVLTNDTIVWDNAANDFDWKLTDAIPHNLKGKFESEPLFVDLKWAKTEKEVTLKSPNFADAIATLAAPLHGVAKEEIYGEENKQHRKFRQVAGAIIVLLILLSAASLREFFQANKQRKEAQNQLAKNFAISANDAFNRNKVLEHLHLMSQAISSAADVESKEFWLMKAHPYLPDYQLKLQFGKAIEGAVFTKKANQIMSWGKDEIIHLNHTATGEEISTMKHKGAIYGAAFNADETKVLSWGPESVSLWNVSNGNQLAGPFIVKTDTAYSFCYGAKLSKDESKILYWGLDTLHIVDVTTGKSVLSKPSRLERLRDVSDDKDTYIKGAEFSKDEQRILSWNNKQIKIYAVNERAPLIIQAKKGFTGAAFSKDESKILSWGSYEGASVWNALTGECISGPFTSRNEFTMYRELYMFSDDFKATFNKSEHFILTTGSDGLVIWQIEDGKKAAGPLYYTDNLGDGWSPKFGGAYMKNENQILSWGPDGIRVIQTPDGKRLVGPLKHKDNLMGVTFNKDETKILSWSTREARLWDRKTGIPLTVMQHAKPIHGVSLSNDEHYILSWGDDGIRIWEKVKQTNWSTSLKVGDKDFDIAAFANDSISKMENDRDFPKELFTLQVQAITGTTLSDTLQTANALPKDQWEKINAAYQKLAEEHFKSCQYPEANYWHRSHQK